MLISFIKLVSIAVGYEKEMYTVTESEGTVELSIIVTKPQSGTPRSFIFLLNTNDNSTGTTAIS